MPRLHKDYVSKRGVYYDLDKSVYKYIDALGNTFLFSSAKQLEIFERKVKIKTEEFCKEADKLGKLGYDINKDYLSQQKRLPLIIYDAIIAEKGENYGKIKKR